ncbi:MDR/zinc-dependent alcohol dehydrogenase-like family protein [Streptomyces flaveolus]|uniref:alcohol dehydrogenase n=1 Tax=Streptomyces flaveolus TaxID=67297 RepID=UPI0036FC1D8D
MRKITDGQGAGISVEVGGAGTIAQSTLAVAHRVTISLIGHAAYDITGMNLLHFTCSGATLRAIGGGSRSDLEDTDRVVPAHRLRPVFDRVLPFEEALDAASCLGSGSRFGEVVGRHGHQK